MRTSRNRLGAAAPQPQEAPSFLPAAHELETFMRGAVANITALFVAGAALERDGYGRSLVLPDEATYNRLLRVARAYRELEAGNAYLQPYQVQPGPSELRWAVVKTGAQLGWWPIALKVMQVAGTVALSGASVYLGDAWLEARNADATANRLRAETQAALATLAAQLKQSGDNAGALKLGESVAGATAAGDKAAKGGDLSWLEQFADGAKTAAAGGAASAALIFAGLWWFSRRKKGRR